MGLHGTGGALSRLRYAAGRHVRAALGSLAMTIEVPSAATAPYVHLRAAPGGRAYSAGVQVEVDVWRDMAHVFQALPPPQGAVAAARIANFIEWRAGWTIVV